MSRRRRCVTGRSLGDKEWRRQREKSEEERDGPHCSASRSRLRRRSRLGRSRCRLNRNAYCAIAGREILASYALNIRACYFVDFVNIGEQTFPVSIIRVVIRQSRASPGIVIELADERGARPGLHSRQRRRIHLLFLQIPDDGIQFLFVFRKVWPS